MVKELRGWGIGMIIMGILSLLLSGILDPVWGIILIILGVINLIVKKRVMFIVNGITLILLGVMNIFSFVLGSIGFWSIYGIMQIGWGIQEINKHNKYL